MHATQAWREDGFTARLSAPGRSVEIPESADVYGWLVGSWELEVGKTVRMEARRSGDTGAGQPPRKVAWQSSDLAVATVSADGQVTGHTPGPVSIIATEDGLTGRCHCGKTTTARAEFC